MSNKITIAGAGIGGLATAIALAKAGNSVDILESASAIENIGAGIQLSPNAMQVLQEYGLEKQLNALAFEPEAATLRHYQSAKPYYSVPLKGVCKGRYGAAYLQIHRADLHKVLLDAALAAGARLHLDQTVISYTQGHTQDDTQANGKVEVQMSDGSTRQADLLIGADGIHSTVRTQMLGEEQARFTGHVAWRGVVQTKKLPPDAIRPLAILPDAIPVPPDATAWLGPGRHLVTYYLRQGDLINFVAVEERTAWVAESWSEKGDLQELRQTFSDWHPSLVSLLDACEECYLWGLFDRKPLPTWSDKNVVLLGDACHPMLPFMAQGAAMAIEDSYVLARCLAQEKNTHEENMQVALNNYEHERKPRTSRVQATATENGKLFHMHEGIGKVVNVLKFKLATLAPSLASKKTDYIYAHDVTK